MDYQSVLELRDCVKYSEKFQVVFSKKIKKQGDNRIAFTMDENEKYTVMLEAGKQSNLIVAVSEN